MGFREFRDFWCRVYSWIQEFRGLRAEGLGGFRGDGLFGLRVSSLLASGFVELSSLFRVQCPRPPKMV